ncbi:TPA: hypothetical protein ENG04_00625 [Candidatus Poribacteria bacterium]|nr:hypothetical protein [Candidatus Poribacteria bacterium]HEX28569.1 hypothetical protein [Candidatus Poribacteria bacterium]
MKGKVSLAVILILILGCGGPEKIWIKVNTPSKIDISRYHSIAVLPLLPLKRDDRNGDQGESISYFIRREIAKVKGINLIDAQTTRRILEGEKISIQTLESPEQMVDICGELGVDAVIAGTYKLYHVSEPRRYYVERYSPQLRQYVTQAVTYYEKTYYLKLHLMLIDSKTGKPILDEEYEPSYSEAHNIGSLIVSEVAQDNPALERLTLDAISQFLKKIAPHYEREERYLLR